MTIITPCFRITTDGFGIKTLLYAGMDYLLQQHPDDAEPETIQYASYADALEAFDYVAAREHYGN